MQVNRITNTQPNQTTFKTVNKKYFEWAKKEYGLVKNISPDWLRMMSLEVFWFKHISSQDGIDTINAVKEYMGKTNVLLEELLDSYQNSDD